MLYYNGLVYVNFEEYEDHIKDGVTSESDRQTERRMNQNNEHFSTLIRKYSKDIYNYLLNYHGLLLIELCKYFTRHIC